MRKLVDTTGYDHIATENERRFNGKLERIHGERDRDKESRTHKIAISKYHSVSFVHANVLREPFYTSP